MHWSNKKPHKSLGCSAAVKGQLLLCPTQLHLGCTERGKPVSDSSDSRNSSYLMHGSIMNLGLKLTYVNISLEGPQWWDMENWEKIMPFRSISAFLGSAIVTLLQNIYMRLFLIFLSSCHFFLSYPWYGSLKMISSSLLKNIGGKSRIPTSAY